jgi:hypothetical protein
MQYKALESTFIFNFGINDITGTGADGTDHAAYVRLKGAAASAAPVYTATPYILTHVSYPNGCAEVAVPGTTANGFLANSEYAVFCTLAVSSVNPTGFIGEFTTTAIATDLDIAAAVKADPPTIGWDPDTVVKANLIQILGTAITETAGQIAAAFTKFFNKATPTGTINSLPDAVAGANGGIPTTNGTKVNQTVDLTAGQSIAVSDKTGFSLSSAGILAIWNQLLSGLTAVGSIGKKLADWVVGTIDTYTGNTKQTADAGAIVSSVTYGNAALQTLIAALNNLSSAQAQAAADAAISANTDIDSIISALGAIAGYIDSEVGAIKTKTDQLIFTTTGKVDARVDYVGSNAVTTPDDFKANITTLATLTDALTKYNDIVDKLKGLMSKNHTLITPVGNFDPADDSNEAIRDHGDTTWVGGGGSGPTGSNVVVLTLHDAIGANIVEASVELFDAGGTVLYARELSDSSGQVTFNLDDGTYIVKIHKAGYSFDDETLVVDGAEAETYTGTAASTANVKNLRYCQVLHGTEYYDVIIAVDTLDQVNDVLQEWALANEDIGVALDLPAALIQNEDIREVLTTKNIDGSVYVKA